MNRLEENLAPDFELLDDTGTRRSLSEYRGKKVVLYFYPKDMTSGCTVEAQCFRDRFNDLRAFGVQVLGISPDSVASHAKFKAAQGLNFPLLVDIEKKVVQKYGVWVEKSMYGRKYMGVQRDTFLIDENGKIIKHYVKVDPKTHVDEVIADLKTLT